MVFSISIVSYSWPDVLTEFIFRKPMALIFNIVRDFETFHIYKRYIPKMSRTTFLELY